MYGFNLGQIEGLDSSVQTVELALEREGQSLSLTLAYDEGDGWWSDNTHQFVLMFNGTTALLWLANATESNVGEVYNITLSVERVEPNFKAAVKKSIEPIQIDMPNIVFQKIQLALGQYATNVISNAGKVCTVPDVRINYQEYADIEEQAEFKSFSIAIANAATFNRETSVYFNGYLVTERQEVRSGDSTVGGSISVSFESKMGDMRFNLSMKIIGFYNGDTIRVKIDAVYPVVLS